VAVFNVFVRHFASLKFLWGGGLFFPHGNVIDLDLCCVLFMICFGSKIFIGRERHGKFDPQAFMGA
jgi:hypothetical protein